MSVDIMTDLGIIESSGVCDEGPYFFDSGLYDLQQDDIAAVLSAPNDQYSESIDNTDNNVDEVQD